jgi:hypothetical protein
MATLFVKHTVGDYKKWRKGFDEFQSHGAQHGIKSAAVFQSAGNPNEVTVMHDFDSVAAAHTFTQAEGLKSAMEKAGVQGAPMMWITEKA